MLNVMRKHAKSWGITVIIGAICVVFAFWGIGSYTDQTITVVATVNGESISTAEFEQAYRQLITQAQERFGDMLTEELLQAMNLKAQAMQRVVDERLIYQQAKAMGVDVSTVDIEKEILRRPEFQVDGVFNKQRYREMLGRFGYSPGQYESLIRKDLVARNVVMLISTFARVSTSEAMEFFHMIKDKLDLNYVVFTPDNFRDQVKPTPEEVKAFYEEHKEKYRVPAKVKVSYLAFRPNDYLDKVQVTDNEITDLYEIYRDKYSHPEQVKAGHILLRFPAEATDEQKAEIKARAEEVLKRAKAGEDFAALAKETSEDTNTAEKGGELGWFDRSQMVKSFADAAFGLEKGAISDLVETEYGWHIIKVEDHRDAGYIPLDEVKAEITEQLKKEKSKEMAADLAEGVYDEISLSHDFDAVVKRLKLSPITTLFFTADEDLSESGLDPKFNQAAIVLDKGEISPLVELPDGMYILKGEDRQESFIPPLEDVIGAVEEDTASEQALRKAQEAAKAFLDKAVKEGDFTKAAEAAELTVETTGPFTRYESVPKIGSDRQLTGDLFGLNVPGQIAPNIYRGEAGYYAVSLAGLEPASEQEFEDNKDRLVASLLDGKGQNYVDQWLKTIREQAEIKVTEGVL